MALQGRLKLTTASFCQLCSIVSRLQAAATDLKEFLTIQPANEFAQNMYTLVKERVEEVKRTHSCN
jgi:hypothetical protein